MHDEWFDGLLKRAHCDAACLSAGGAVAYYPTQIPLRYRSRFLGEVARVRLLRAGTAPGVRGENGGLIVQVPSVLEHEVVAIDFTGFDAS